MKEFTLKPYADVVEFINERLSVCSITDHRDRNRLVEFAPDEKSLEALGFSIKKGSVFADLETQEYTPENVLKQVYSDIDFAIEKAKDQRGISSNLMFEVLQMLNFAFDTGLSANDHYDDYGLSYAWETAKAFEYTPKEDNDEKPE